MATTHRKFSSGSLLLGLVIFLVVTLILASSAKRKLAKTVQSEEYPSAKEMYTQLSEDKGDLFALKAMFSGKDMPTDSGEKQIGNKKILPNGRSVRRTANSPKPS